jgi:hypothetical protein
MSNNGKFELTVYPSPGHSLTALLTEGGNPGAVDTVPFAVYSEDMLERGIADGTLYPGVFDEYKTRPPYVSDWPKRFQALKLAYAEGNHGTNDPY